MSRRVQPSAGGGGDTTDLLLERDSPQGPIMDTDRNLLFGALTVEADLVDDGQLTEACSAWASGEAATLADVMVGRGLISPEDRAAVEEALGRKLREHGGDTAATLAATSGGLSGPATEAGDDPSARGTMTMGPDRPGHVVLSALDAPPGTHPRYTRTRLHATGGIGRVWLARDSSFGREVALKEIRPEREANEVVWSRFLEEARITGQLEHPGIVPVYELSTGDIDSGPYYTMRFVKGRTLLEASHDYRRARDEGKATALDLSALLNAFVAVCNAVAYAHARGVIHRDLKGQNVVLGDFGEVIVLDWGLAKLVDGPPAEGIEPATLPDDGLGRFHTIAGRALGTPAYMPPEQAAGRLDEVDRRSDVYGLGAILYEILAGRAPFDGPKTAEILRRVVEEEPVRPRTVAPATPPALEAICLKAMAKNQADRYDSAGSLATDVRRWLADEPVAAYPEPWTKRAGRWAKRHRTAVASAAALLVTATVALAISTVLIRRERNEALLQRNEARAQRKVSRSVVDDMYTQVAEKWLEDRLDPVQREFLEKALAHYETFAAQDADDPAIRLERGLAYRRVGDILHKLGRNPEAERAYRRSLDALDALDALPAGARQGAAVGRSSLGVLLADQGKFPEAEALFRRALEVQEPLATGPDPAPRLGLAATHKGLADLLRVTGRNDEAEASYRRAADVLKDLPTADDDLTPRQLLAATRDRLGLLYKETGRLGEAAASYGHGLEVLEPLVARYPTLPRLREAFVNGLRSVGLLYQSTGKDPEALAALRRALEVADRLAKDFPLRPEYRRDLAKCHLNLGLCLWSRGDLGAAEPHYRAAVPLYEALVAEVPGVLKYRQDLGKISNNLALLLRAVGKAAEAEAFAARAIATYEDLAALAPDVPEHRKLLAESQLNLAFVLEVIGQVERAGEALRKSQAIHERLAAEFPKVPEHRRSLAKTLHHQTSLLITTYRRAVATARMGTDGLPDAGPRDRAGRMIRRAVAFARAAADRTEAERSIRRAIAIDDALAAEFPGVPEYRHELANGLNSLVALNPPDAEDSCRRALAIYRKLAADAPGVDDHRMMVAVVSDSLGHLLAGAGHDAEADAAFAEASDLLDALAAKTPTDVERKSRLGQVVASRGDLRLDRGKPAEARPFLERAIALQRAALAANDKNPEVRRALHGHLTSLAGAAIDLGNPAEAARLAGDLIPLAPDRPEGCRDAARLLARCSASAESAPGLPDDRRKALADAFASRAVALLREATAPGLPTLARLDTDTALAPLRSRDDFKQLVASLNDRATRPGH